MRDAGKMLADLHYYVPQDEEDYFMQTGKLSKALAAIWQMQILKEYVFLKDKMMVAIRMHKVLL